ncbi:MAG: PAS domain S-box protein [Geobacter sp.]|nr:PAS domain S-box protein [Geobacter sp.]
MPVMIPQPRHNSDKLSAFALLARIIAVILLVFVIEFAADQLLPKLLPYSDPWAQVLADSILLILFSAPFIWWIVFRPLRAAALAEKAQFEHLLQQIVDAVIILDELNRLSSCNAAAESIFGSSAEQLVGAPIQTIIACPEGSPELFGSSHETADADKPVVRLDCFGLRGDGERIPLSLSASEAVYNGRRVRILIVRDLTKIRVAEQALEKSYALLEATLQSTADGILAVSWDRQIQLYNRQFVDLFRIPGNLMENRDYRGMFEYLSGLMAVPADFRTRVEELYRDQHSISHDILLLADGRIIERHSQPQLVNGESIGRVWSFSDSTDRIRAERELKQSEERFRNLADFAPVGIFETDATGNCIFVNRQWCRIAGIVPEQALGRGWATALHPDDAQLIEDEWYESVREGRPFSLEYRFRTPDGRENWVLGSATALRGSDEGITGYLGIIIDINERKVAESALLESEERFRKVFEQSEDAIILFLPGTCTIIDVNPTTEKLYGYSREELIGLHFNVFRSKDEYHEFIHAVCMLQEPQTSQFDHMINVRKDGAEIHVSVRAKVIKLQGDEAIYCTLRDITQRLQMEEEARTIQSQLIHANKMTSLGLLVAGIAHEINNPNNYIMANAQMLYRIWEDLDPLLRDEAARRGDFQLGGLPYSRLEEALPEMITAISEGARRIKGIIGSLKSYSRQGAIVMGDLDINQTVRASLQLLSHHINKYTDSFIVELGEELPALRGNAQQLEQVIVNLVMNALQSLTCRSQRITLKTGYDKENRAVCLTVADEGCGIPDGVKARIMEPFFTTKLDAGGTGLGLSITRSIVLTYHGSIEVYSQAGQGTTVHVSLPAIADTAAEAVLPAQGDALHE